MKKILIAAAAMALTIPVTYAQALPGYLTDGKLLIEYDGTLSENVVAVCYDNDGRLVYGAGVTAAEGFYSLEIPQDSQLVRLFDIGNTSCDVNLITAETTSTAVPTEQPADKTLNPAYEKEVDAVNAFAVVDKVSTTVNANNEEVYSLSCLCQDTEVTVEIPSDTLIKSAPDAFSELIGDTADSLKKGDVIYCEMNPSRTKIRGIYVIYRPTDIFESNRFYNYFTHSGKAGGLWNVIPYGEKAPSERCTYAFGIVADKYENTLLLYSKDGLYDNSIEIDYTKDTVTYICDMEGKPDVKISSPSSIKKSKISKSAIDEDDNIIFSDDMTYTIALVRLIDGTASDIIVYQNVEF